MAQNPQLSAAELQELAKLYKQVLGYSDQIATAEASRAQSVGTARVQLELMRKELEAMTKDITDQVEAFRDIAKEISGQRDGIKETVKGFKSLRSIAEKIQYHQKDLHELSLKDIESLQEKLKIERQRFEETDKQLKKEAEKLRINQTSYQQQINHLMNQNDLSATQYKRLGKLLDLNEKINAELIQNEAAQNEIAGIVNETDANYRATDETLKKIAADTKHVNKQMGLGGALAKTLAKNLPHSLSEYMGLDDVIAKMKAVAKTSKGVGGAFSVLGTGLKAAGGNMMSGMMSGANPYVAAGGLLVKVIQFFIDLMFEADKRVTELAHSLNVSKDAARGIYEEGQKIANNADDYAQIQEGNSIIQEDIFKTQSKFNTVLGMSVNLIDGFGEKGKNVLAQLTDMVKFLQLSDEELQGMVNLFAATGKPVENIKNQILGTTKLLKQQTGYQYDERKILKDVLTTSNAIRLTMKSNLDSIVKSVAEASKLGKNLKELSTIGDSLLNFEQSISAELEAEVLLNRDLNLERARGAYFAGNMEDFTKEVNRLVKESGPDFEKNVIAQQALAAALGISREELADMIAEQKKFEEFQNNQVKLSEKEVAILQEKLKLKGKEANLTEGIKQSLMSGNLAGRNLEGVLEKLGFAGDELTDVVGQISANSLESTDAQQKFNDALEKAKDIFRNFVDGEYLDKFATFLSGFVNAVAKGGLIHALTGGAQEEAGKIAFEKAGIKVNEGTGLFGTGAFKSTEFYTPEGKMITEFGYGGHLIGGEGIAYANETLAEAQQFMKSEDYKKNKLTSSNEDVATMIKILEEIQKTSAATANKNFSVNYEPNKASVADTKQTTNIP
jgi:hypothetical protein